MGAVDRLQTLRRVAQLLDSAFPVPGTSFRFGLDPILGLIPGFGDMVSPLFAIAILWQARAMGIPRVVQLRMVFNVAIDAAIGSVPLIGDLFDFAWRANNKNIALLERHGHTPGRASAADWLFVITISLLIVIVGAIPFVVLGWLLSLIGRRLF